MNIKLRTRRAFTLIELVAAIGILVVVLTFASVIFKVSINSHRTVSANAEIMRKLRVITDQLNIDFKGFRKDGYLILRSELLNRNEYMISPVPADFRADRVCYFSTGDSQSWDWNFPNVRSNIAKVYFGHDSRSLNDATFPVSEWSLARDVKLMTPGHSLIDSNDVSFAAFKANVVGTENQAQNLLTSGIPIDIQNPSDIRGLMCQNVGEIKIEWTNGIKVGGTIVWFGFLFPSGFPVETLGPPYMATWTPLTPEQYWPKALKFTFKIYDSKGILKQGRIFTHIVYFGD